MNILFLGPLNGNVESFLTRFGDRVIAIESPLLDDDERLVAADFIVSYGYRHILKKNVLERFPCRAINLHISFLPWNRGADPNLWSFLEDTPKGVTVHFLDCGIDTGDIIVQQEVSFESNDTLSTSYVKLIKAMERLFMGVWPDIRNGKVAATPQPLEGTYHRMKDRETVAHLLTKGWDTPVAGLIGTARLRNDPEE